MMRAGPTLDCFWSRPLVGRTVRERLGLARPFRAIYLSDFHCAPWSGRMLAELEREISARQPEVVLFGGDLIDFPCGYATFLDFCRKVARRRPILAVPGNHDRWAGLGRLKRQLGDVRWLDDEPVMWPNGLRLCGRAEQGGTPQSLLVGHEPNRVTRAARSGFPLMLAGHLHGCQWIAFQRNGLDYPGAWFFAYHGDFFQVGPTRLYVSRGVSDTLPLRINCPREYLWLEIA